MMRSSTFRLSGEFIAECCGGVLVYGEGVVAESGVTIDSRTAQPKEAFVAIRGQRHDGHAFLEHALARGVVGLVVERHATERAVQAARSAASPVFVVVVEDTTRALKTLAAAWVSVLQPLIVAITGSVGKTTTKDLSAAVLGARHAVHATTGNHNNALGLSLTSLKLLPAHEVLVAEMGMSGPGELRELCRITPPKVGVVTAVAPVHLEQLGTLEAIRDAKAEMVESLSEDGTAVLNADDPYVMTMASRTRARVVSFGSAADADVRVLAVNVGLDGRAEVRLGTRGEEAVAKLWLIGRHHAQNAAAAAAVGAALGVPLAEACQAMEQVRPGRHRLETVTVGTLRILDDCYNASPRSVSAALRVLAEIPTGGRKVAVLGDMLELGDATAEAHLQAGREAAQAGVECLLAVGRNAGLIRQGALEGGLMPAAVFMAPDAIAAASVALAIIRPRDTVLVKGSRGVGLEHVVEALAGRFASGELEGN